MPTPEDAFLAIKDEISDGMDHKGINDGNLGMVTDAFVRALGKSTIYDTCFMKKSA